MRTRQLAPHSLELYLVNAWLSSLPEDLKNFFPEDIWSLIKSYILDLREIFPFLFCPASGLLLEDPVVLVSREIAPVVYHRFAVSNAIASEELKRFNLTDDKIQPVPFVKTFLKHITQISTNLSLIRDSQDDKEDVDQGDEKRSRGLLEEIDQSTTIYQNNLGKLIKYYCDYGDNKNSNLDLVEVIKKFDAYILQKRSFQAPAVSNRPGFVTHILFLLTVHALCLPRFYQYAVKSDYNLIPNVMLEMGYSIHVLKLLENSLDFLIGNIQPSLSNIFSVFALLVLHGAMDFVDIHLTIPGEANSWMALLLYYHYCSQATLTDASLKCLLLHGNDNPIQPYLKRTRLHQLFDIISISNILFKTYYTWLYLIKYEREDSAVWMLGLVANLVLPIPRVLCANPQAAAECQYFVSNVKNRHRFFSSPYPSLDLPPYPSKPSTTPLELLCRFSSALLMGIMAYAISDNPFYALVAAIAMFNEGALSHAIHAETTGYQLKKRF